MAENISNAMDVKESLEAAEFIVKYAKDVRINFKKLESFTEKLIRMLDENTVNELRIFLNGFCRPVEYLDFNEETVNWLFVFHTLNFSLYNPRGTKQWTVGNKNGYNALGFAMKRAKDEGKPLWDPKYYTALKRRELMYIFRSDDRETTIPLINMRLMILRMVGNVLLEKYEGTFKNCVKSANYNADNLMKLLFDEFGPYRDEAEYENIKVRLYTKANSLVSDIWAYYKEQNKFHLNKENMMSTIFIDYRSPIVLYYFKILTYSENLNTKFRKKGPPLKHGDKEELELRACSLVAVNEIIKRIVTEWRYKHPEYDRLNISLLIDNILLSNIAQDFHKFVSILDQHPFHYFTYVHY